MFCNRCGSKLINENDLFCPYCGTKRNIAVSTVNQTEVNNTSAEPVQQPTQQFVEEQQPIQEQQPMEESNTPISLSKPMESSKVSEVEKPTIPEGFVLDPASGWYFKSKGKQLPNGSYVNEITWFEPKEGKTTVKDYPMSAQQVNAMLQASRKQGMPNQTIQNPNQTQGAYSNYTQGQNQGYQGQQSTYQGQQSTYQNQQTIAEPPKKKSKTGLIIGIVAAVVVIALGLCTWKFEWYKIVTGDVETAKIVKEEPTPTPTSLPTPTPEPENPLGELNEDYIVIGGQEFETTVTALYLDSLELTNQDIEPLQYMKNLEELYIASNSITSLEAIKDLTSLETLDASYNQIYDVVALSDLTNIESLNLDHTQVSDLSPLASLTNLSSLGITYTEVFDLTPLVSLPSLMYLNILNSEVEDFSPLSMMPSLYMCDVTFDSNDPADPINPDYNNNGQNLSDFEFTEADDLYFIPLTNNYIITTMFEDDSSSLLLLSYDENDQCVQIRMRMDIGYELSTEDMESYKDIFSEEMTNINFDGSLMYMDYPLDDVTYDYTKEELINYYDSLGCEILVNVSE